jgi:hypothetical protein
MPAASAPIAPVPVVPRVIPRPQPAGPPAERFDFRENLAASSGDTAAVAKHRPKALTAYIEVLTDDGQVVASDTVKFNRGQQAPHGPAHLGRDNEINCTYVVIGETNKAQQEFTAPLGDIPGLPFGLPGHLKNKDQVGGTMIRAWWSCEEEET